MQKTNQSDRYDKKQKDTLVSDLYRQSETVDGSSLYSVEGGVGMRLKWQRDVRTFACASYQLPTEYLFGSNIQNDIL